MGALSAQLRRASATVKPSKGYPSGRFPMPNKKHARLAEELLPTAKGLSAGQKQKIRNRAERMLGQKGR